MLYRRRGRNLADSHYYDVVYIGMAETSIRRRLGTHRRHKAKFWTHFSYFEVWDNIGNEEITELEGLFRHLYRYDSRANALNRQKGYKGLVTVGKQTERQQEGDDDRRDDAS